LDAKVWFQLQVIGWACLTILRLIQRAPPLGSSNCKFHEGLMGITAADPSERAPCSTEHENFTSELMAPCYSSNFTGKMTDDIFKSAVIDSWDMT
jgi:hypothetical protein